MQQAEQTAGHTKKTVSKRGRFKDKDFMKYDPFNHQS